MNHNFFKKQQPLPAGAVQLGAGDAYVLASCPAGTSNLSVMVSPNLAPETLLKFGLGICGQAYVLLEAAKADKRIVEPGGILPNNGKPTP